MGSLRLETQALVSLVLISAFELAMVASGRTVRDIHLAAATGLWLYYLAIVYAVDRRWLKVGLPSPASSTKGQAGPKVKSKHRPNPKTKAKLKPKSELEHASGSHPVSFWVAIGSGSYLVFWIAAGLGVAWAGWLARSQLTGRPQAALALSFFLAWTAISLVLFAAGRLVRRRAVGTRHGSQ